jgi:hypothetical protein
MKSNIEIGYEQLNLFSSNLESTEYVAIINLIKNSIKIIPITSAILTKGTFIDRVRPNDGENLFVSEDQISYIKDKVVIDKYMTKYGRCNQPHQVMFYGAIESSIINKQRVTAISETSRIFKDVESINLEGELLTLSRWEVMEDIVIVELVFHDAAIQINPDTRKSFYHHFPQIFESPDREIMLKLLKLFSFEFAKVVSSHEHFNYKISTAFTNLVINDGILPDGRKIEGITYPSVVSGYQGQNIVLRPDVVNQKLKLKYVTTHSLHKNKLKSFINNHKLVSDFGINNSNFTWQDADPKFVVPIDELIKLHLN